MKIAEALIERSDLKKKIEQLRERISENVLVQAGETPGEDPNEMRKELELAVMRLEYLIRRINITNVQTMANGRSLTEIIAEKDALNLSVSVYKTAIRRAGQIGYRVRGSEIKLTQAISVAEWQKQVDVMSKKIRELDTLLQKTNWTVDLIE